KGLLPFDSAHSKLVKRSIASSCMQAALVKSCPHSMAESFEQQTVRLAEGGYPSSVLLAVAETLLKKIKGGPHQRRDRPSKRPQVIPYQHRISHNLKKVAGRFDVPVVFSAPLGAVFRRAIAAASPYRICHPASRKCRPPSGHPALQFGQSRKHSGHSSLHSDRPFWHCVHFAQRSGHTGLDSSQALLPRHGVLKPLPQRLQRTSRREDGSGPAAVKIIFGNVENDGCRRRDKKAVDPTAGPPSYLPGFRLSWCVDDVGKG
ncbi:hypothetical protein HPB47_027317, partial [Ixodes persulcatus]